MSDYPQYPTDPTNPATAGGAPPTRGARPASVDLALKLIYGIIALSLIGAVITFAMLDSIVDDALADAGVSESVDADAVRAGAIGGAIIGLVISVGLYLLLAYFIAKGANWARIVYTVLAVLGLLASLISFGGSQPVLLLLLSVLQLLLTVGVLVLLWKQESTAFFKAR